DGSPLDLTARPDPHDLTAPAGDLATWATDDLTPGPPDLLDRVGPYPPGPYGTGIGDVAKNLTIKGFLDVPGVSPANMVPYGDLPSQALRRSGARYALLATGAFW